MSNSICTQEKIEREVIDQCEGFGTCFARVSLNGSGLFSNKYDQYKSLDIVGCENGTCDIFIRDARVLNAFKYDENINYVRGREMALL